MIPWVRKYALDKQHAKFFPLRPVRGGENVQVFIGSQPKERDWAIFVIVKKAVEIIQGFFVQGGQVHNGGASQ